MFMALIRHGEYAQPADTPSAWLPQGLVEAGRRQACAAAEQIADLVRTHGLQVHPTIDCSRMRRAWETARLIADQLGTALGLTFDVEQFDALAERGVGALANLTLQQIEQHIDDDPRFEPLPAGWKSTSNFKLPVQGAESLMEAGERVRAHVERRLEGLDSETLKLFVGHGASIRHGAHLLGMLTLQDIPHLSMHYAAPIVFERSANGWIKIAGDWKTRSKVDRAD